MRKRQNRYRPLSLAVFLPAGVCLVTLCGCIAGPPPDLAPERATRQMHDHAQSVAAYDMNGDGSPEYGESLDASGRIDRLYYDEDQDGTWDERIVLSELPRTETRQLLILLDSVPFGMVQAAWDQGLLRYFPRPTRVVAPFPVMTDLSFSEFFGCSPCPGPESEYYDGKKLTSGYEVYFNGGNTPWMAYTDYRLSPARHAAVYLDAKPWYDHELRHIQEVYRRRDDALTIGYVVSTSALGARVGREGHEYGLKRLDRFCRRMVYETHGRIRLTLMSDHGHHFDTNHRVDLDVDLRAKGYHVVTSLHGPQDAVVPEFGLVSYAGVYTEDPPSLARAVLDVHGVDVVAYMDPGDQVVVLNREGRAIIERVENGYRYTPTRGDPLKLDAALRLTPDGADQPQSGILSDPEALRLASTQEYPDAMHRLWRAFHGLTEHPPQVVISLANGYYSGSGTMSSLVHLYGIHGNLKQDSTFGFAMSMEGLLPETIRMEDLRQAVNAIGVPVRQP